MNNEIVFYSEDTGDLRAAGGDGAGWYFWVEPEAYLAGPFGTREEAQEAMNNQEE